MTSAPVQTRANHARFDPLFHFCAIPVLVLTLLFSVYRAVRSPIPGNVWAVVLFMALLVLALRVRSYALRVQDRVIRLEERLRLERLLPDWVRWRMDELTEQQLIALRFASDAELAELASRAMEEKLTPKQIKDAIQEWRPDYLRV